MIDLHCHIAPGLDDGPPDAAASLDMARAAARDGIKKVVATPHVDLEYMVQPGHIATRVRELGAALAASNVEVVVASGGEVALARLPGLEDAALRELGLGGTPYLLIESPYNRTGSFIEEAVFDLRIRGFRPVLAHPERCPEFQRAPQRLSRLVREGAICSVSAGSLVGQFGATVRRFAVRLVEDGLVHNVATDAHDLVRRPPVLRTPFEEAERYAPGISSHIDWFTDTVPAAILAGERVPPAPRISQGRGVGWRRRIGFG